MSLPNTITVGLKDHSMMLVECEAHQLPELQFGELVCFTFNQHHRVVFETDSDSIGKRHYAPASNCLHLIMLPIV